jgi:hypothetical protein
MYQEYLSYYSSGLAAGSYFEITDLTGRIISAGPTPDEGTDLSGLSAGSCLTSLSGSKGERTTKPFIKN